MAEYLRRRLVMEQNILHLHESGIVDTSLQTSSRMKQCWIDVYKGFAIIAVTVAHIIPEYRFFYLFHMPMFFFLAGYTLHPTVAHKTFIVRKSKRLLIPHLEFFLLLLVAGIFLPYQANESVIQIVKHYVYDTESLIYDYGVFWYMPVFFISLVVCNILINNRLSPIYWMIILYVFSIMLGFFHISTFQSIQNVPLACTYMLIGYQCRSFTARCFCTRTTVVLSIALLIVLYFLPDRYLMDMKHANMGIPVLSTLLSLLSIGAVIVISEFFQNYKVLYVVLSAIGSASIVIMYLHQFIHYRLEDYLPASLLALVSLLIPTFLYFSYKFLFNHERKATH